MRCALSISFLLATLVLAGCAEKGGLLAPKYADEGVQWGEAVGGLRVGLARRNYVEGKEPGRGQEYFALHLKNVGDESISVLSPVAAFGTIPEELGGDETVLVKLTYDSAAGIKNGEFKPFKKPVVHTLAPGEGFRMELRLAPSRFGLDRFVTGRMTATYSNAQEAIRYKSVDDAETKGLWTGSATSGFVTMDGGGQGNHAARDDNGNGSNVLNGPHPGPLPHAAERSREKRLLARAGEGEK